MADPVTDTAVLPVAEETVHVVSGLLATERRRRGTRGRRRALGCYRQAVLALRWFCEDTGMPTLARDAEISRATGYRYLHEGIAVLAAQAPDLHSVLKRGKADGWSHVTVDGTLIVTDRCRTKNPDTGHACGSPATPDSRRQRAGGLRPGRVPGRGLRRRTRIDP